MYPRAKHDRGLVGSRIRASLLTAASLLALCVSSGCEFGGEDAAVMNTCTVDLECGTESSCQDGLCIKKGPAGLSISLQVIPARLPDGASPIPITLGAFALDGHPRNFELPLPITVNGSVRGKDKKLFAATLRFTPTRVAEGQSASALMATSTKFPSTDDEGNLSVQLLSGVTYRVTCEPDDTSQAPYSMEFTATPGTPLDIDYAKTTNVDWLVKGFLITGLPADRKLTMRALDSVTGAPVSNTAPVGSEGETVRLTFAPEHDAYRLEIAAAESYGTKTENASADDPCAGATSAFPVLTVDESALRQDETGTNVFALPKIPEPINYSGTVRFCRGTNAGAVSTMPMALDAESLSFGESDGAVHARYSATTTAIFSAAKNEFRFCTKVLPGDYVVVITPPLNVQCENFAERHRIELAEGETSVDTVLELRRPAVLTGTIETSDMTPVGNASIEARALGRPLALADNDPSVPSYNRSAQATTDVEGMFRLPVDVGSYDLVFKPLTDSGFAWQVVHDVDIGSRRDAFANRVTLDAPVLVHGTLRYAGAARKDQLTLAGAEVRAYTQVGDGTRSIEVARAIADENGEVTLLIAPTLRSGW